MFPISIPTRSEKLVLVPNNIITKYLNPKIPTNVVNIPIRRERPVVPLKPTRGPRPVPGEGVPLRTVPTIIPNKPTRERPIPGVGVPFRNIPTILPTRGERPLVPLRNIPTILPNKTTNIIIPKPVIIIPQPVVKPNKQFEINKQRFLANPTINPLTNRKIQIGAKTYHKLIKTFGLLSVVNDTQVHRTKLLDPPFINIETILPPVITQQGVTNIPHEIVQEFKGITRLLPSVFDDYVDNISEPTLTIQQVVDNNISNLYNPITRRTELVTRTNYTFNPRNDDRLPVPSAQAFIPYVQNLCDTNEDFEDGCNINLKLVVELPPDEKGRMDRVGFIVPIPRKRNLNLLDQLAQIGIGIDGTELIYRGGNDPNEFIAQIINEYGANTLDAIVDKSFFFLQAITLRGGAMRTINIHGRWGERIYKKGLMCIRTKPQGINNCLIECIIAQLESKEVPDDIRLKCNIPLNMPLGLDYLHNLEQYFGKTIGICIDRSFTCIPIRNGARDDNSWGNIRSFTTDVIRRNIYEIGSDNSDIIVYLEKAHYFLVIKEGVTTDKFCRFSGAKLYRNDRGQASHKDIVFELVRQGRLDHNPYMQLKIKKQPIREHKPVYWSYDFETTSGVDDNVIAPISVSIVKIDYNEQIKECKIATSRKNRPVEFVHASQDCHKKMLEWLLTTADENDENILLSYNGRRFDNFILLEELISRDRLSERDVSFDNNSILQIEWGKTNSDVNGYRWRAFRTIDVNSFIPGSLASNCEAFGVQNTKLSMDHNLIQSYRFLNTINETMTIRIPSLTHLEIRNTNNMVIGYRPGEPIFTEVTMTTNNEYPQLYSNINEHLSTPEERRVNQNAGMDKYLEYNRRDCLATAELFFKVEEAMKKLVYENISNGGLNVRTPVTITKSRCFTMSQLIFKYWPKRSEYILKNVTDDSEAFDKFVRQAICAGRSQVFRRGHFQGEFASFDVKSLYPFVMMSETCKYPIGVAIKTDHEVINKLGIYRCTVGSQQDLYTKILPMKVKMLYNWTGDEVGEKILTSVDILTLRDYNVEVTVHDGYYWNENGNVFADYMKPFAQTKTAQDNLKGQPGYNLALRSLCKIIMNSLSGKTLQRVINKNTLITAKEDKIADFHINNSNVTFTAFNNALILKGNKNELKYDNGKPVHLGVFIYSYARRHMYLSILSKLTSKILTDTDSCLVNLQEPDVQELLREAGDDPSQDPLLGTFGRFHLGSKFGNFEDEFVDDLAFGCNEVYAVAPKFYCCDYVNRITNRHPDIITIGDKRYYTTEGRQNVLVGKKSIIKMRCKGIGKNDKRLDITKEAFDALSIQGKFEKYQQLSKAMTPEFYADMINNEPVNVLCSHITRKIIDDRNDRGIILHQEYQYKQLNKFV